MILLERKEQLDKFIKEVLSNVDVFLYPPLGKYINLSASIIPLTSKVIILQRKIRKYLSKINLNMVTFFLFFLFFIYILY